MKDKIRKDCSNANMIIIPLLVSIVLCLGLSFEVADVKGLFLQRGPILREIFVRPASEFRKKQGILCRLTKPTYGIVEAGRQWAKIVEAWMLRRAGLKGMFGVNQGFFKR